MTEVTALVIGSLDDCMRGLDRAALAEVIRSPTLAVLVDSAREARSPFVWLVDSGAVPAEGALGSLLDAEAELAVSLPVDAGGRPVETLVGRFTETDVPAILLAASMHRVPLRHTYVTSLLARRDIVIAESPPNSARFGRYAGPEWTSRLFSRRPGMLVPRSRVRAPVMEPGHPLHAIRMSRTGLWGRGEALLELHRSMVGRFTGSAA